MMDMVTRWISISKVAIQENVVGSDSAGGVDYLEPDGLDKVATSQGSKTVGKGNCCLGWWMNNLLYFCPGKVVGGYLIGDLADLDD